MTISDFSAEVQSPSIRWRRVTVVLNRESGTISSLGPDAVKDELEQMLHAHDVEVEIACVPGAEIPAALERACAGNAEVIWVGGGDGTVASAATQLAGNNKPLGVLPLGTFNLAARDLGVPLDWKEAVDALLRAPAVEVDAMEVGGNLYLCVVVLGFYPALALGRSDYHGSWLVKTARTALDVMKGATQSARMELVLTDETGKETMLRTRMALMVNNDYEDLFGLIPQRRSLDAGWFTTYVSTHRTRWGMARAVLAWVFGRWKQEQEVTFFRCRKLRINAVRRRRLPIMMDGELDRLSLPFEITLRPRALSMVSCRDRITNGEALG